MLDMGFRPAVDRIVGLCRTIADPVLLATLEAPPARPPATTPMTPVPTPNAPAERVRRDIDHRFQRVESAR